MVDARPICFVRNLKRTFRDVKNRSVYASRVGQRFKKKLSSLYVSRT